MAENIALHCSSIYGVALFVTILRLSPFYNYTKPKLEKKASKTEDSEHFEAKLSI